MSEAGAGSDLAAAVASADAMDGEAMILQAKAAMIRITAELTPVFSARLTDAVAAEIERQNAEAARKVPASVAERISRELAEVESRAAQAAAAVRSHDVNDRISGRVQVAACEAERESLTAKLNAARGEAASAQTAFRLAELRVKHAYAMATAALDGMHNPLTSPVGQATEAYSRWLADSGMWRNDPTCSTARELVREYLGPSGIGREIQREAIAAYISGDPLALAAGGTDHLPSGSEVRHAPGIPPLVSGHRMSAHEAAEAAQPLPPAPPPDLFTPPSSARPGF